MFENLQAILRGKDDPRKLISGELNKEWEEHSGVGKFDGRRAIMCFRVRDGRPGLD